MTDIKTPEERSRDAATALTNALNDMGFHADSFVDEINRTHPTIRQTLAGALRPLLHRWAEAYDNQNYDARDEASKKWAWDLIHGVGDHEGPGRFPFI